VAIY
jgi:TnpA family transposase